MRSFIVAANWKMYGSFSLLESWLERLRADLTWGSLPVEVVSCVPHVYLHWFAEHSQALPLVLGAQNMSESEQGAYTGEIAADMLRDLKCQYVILGHSERRRYFHEQELQVAMKVAQAKRYGLRPILCVGESEEAYRTKQSEKVISQQIQAVVDLLGTKDALDSVVLAYEPVWAIGTGHAATVPYIAKMHAFIRDWIAQNQSQELADSMPLLYGGSLKPHNAAEIFSLEDVDGGLIGSAALDAEQFLGIISCIKLCC